MDLLSLNTDFHTVVMALLLTLGAGMATAIGAALSLSGKGPSERMTAGALGLSAGVMIYISLVELLPEAAVNFAIKAGPKDGMALAALSFFGGIAVMAIIDKLVPEDENPHEMHTMDELSQPGNHHLKRTGMMLAVAIGIHNFPEGMATFVSALDGISVALPIVIAIAIHNIPEGVAVAVPLYNSTRNRRKAFYYSLLAGLAEPVGALAGALILMPLWTPVAHAICLGATAGVMVYISFDELLPSAESYGEHHISLWGVITGMAIMASSLWLL